VFDEDAGGDRPRVLADNLLTRAADVTLKERRRLVLMVRETPFNLAHLRNMTAATEMGGVVFPPLPAFYHRPQTIDELVDDTVERVLSPARRGPGARRRPGAACRPLNQASGGQPGWPARRAPHSGIRRDPGCRCSGPSAMNRSPRSHVQVVAQDHAAEAQVGLHVEQRAGSPSPMRRVQNGMTCM
jgi:hypothetical protein